MVAPCMVAQGVCVVALGGCAWLLWGGVRGCSGGDIHGCSGGHAWLLWGGMRGCSGGGHAWLLWGGGMHGFFDEIWSMSGRYASYWNAFLLLMLVISASDTCVMVNQFVQQYL